MTTEPDPAEYACPLAFTLGPFDCGDGALFSPAGLIAHLVDEHDPADVARQLADLHHLHQAMNEAVYRALNEDGGYDSPAAWRHPWEDQPITITRTP